MRHLRVVIAALFCSSLIFSTTRSVVAAPPDSTFTYQGRVDGVPPGITTADFRFGLWTAATGGMQVGEVEQFNAVLLKDGIFTVQLNTGNAFEDGAFDSGRRWLEIAVRARSDEFVTLAPRQPVTAAPRALSVLGQVRTFNVRDYGAVGNGVANDTASVRDAVNAVTEEGGIVYFPPGTYRVRANEVCLRSKTWLLGAGDASLIVRIPNTNAGVFNARGASSIRVSHLAFDLAHQDGSETVLSFLPTSDPGPCGNTAPSPHVGCSGIVVENCSFYTSSPLREDITLHAILARGASDVRVTGNRVDGLQFKLAGPANGLPAERIIVAGNSFSRPRNLAVSVVVPSSDHDIRDVLVAGNVIVGPLAEAGIWVGTDGSEGLAGDCEHIRICDNVITGDAEPTRRTNFIRVRTGATTKQVVISGNIIECFNRATGSKGIEVLLGGGNPGPVRDLLISNNTVKGTDLAGIRLWTGAERAVVQGNSLSDTRGLEVIAKANGIASLSIVANSITGRLDGIVLNAVDGPLSECVVVDNILKDVRGTTASDDVVGIELTSSGPKISATVRGNIVRGAEPPDALTQDYAIAERGTGTFDIRYLDNDVRGYRVAGLSLVNPCAVVGGNIGWRTESSGIAAFTPGAVSVLVPHDLDVTPTLAQIVLTPGGGGAGSPGEIWVQSIDATRITFRCESPPSTPLTFGWRVLPPTTGCP